MKARLFSLFILLACMLIQAQEQALAQTKAQAQTQSQPQQSFPYPALPDTLRSVEQRAGYLSEHYWDNYNFADTLMLKSEEVTEQGFVNFIDILGRFSPAIAQKGIAGFTRKAFTNAVAKERFESLIEHYFENPQSPLRNDRVYLLFLEEMKNSPCFDEAEKERLAFKIKTTNKNLPGDIAINFNFKDENGKSHQLSDYREQKVILYFYDPDCENCHKVSAWLKQQTIPADIKVLKIIADNPISHIYSLRAMPTIFLLDKGNLVVLKDCTAQELIAYVSSKH
jgi:hypothetical protein